MGLIGKTISNGGKIVGTIAEYNIKLTGQIVGAVLDIADKEDYAKKTRSISKNTGEFVGTAATVFSQATGVVVDKAIEIGASTVKYIGKNAIKTNVIQYGDSRAEDEDKFVNADYKIVK